MLGLLRATTVALAAFSSVATSIAVPMKDKIVMNSLDKPKETMPDCEKCEAPYCSLSHYAFKTKMSNLLWPAQDKKSYKEWLAPSEHNDDLHPGASKTYTDGEVMLHFDEDVSRLGLSGRIESTYENTAILGFDVYDARVEVSNTPQKRKEGFEKYTVPKGEDLPPIFLISQPGKKCKFNIFPSGFDQKHGKVDIYSQVDDL